MRDYQFGWIQGGVWWYGCTLLLFLHHSCCPLGDARTGLPRPSSWAGQAARSACHATWELNPVGAKLPSSSSWAKQAASDTDCVLPILHNKSPILTASLHFQNLRSAVREDGNCPIGKEKAWEETAIDSAEKKSIWLDIGYQGQIEELWWCHPLAVSHMNSQHRVPLEPLLSCRSRAQKVTMTASYLSLSPISEFSWELNELDGWNNRSETEFNSAKCWVMN